METPKIISADFVFAALVNGDEVLYTFQRPNTGNFLTYKLSESTMNHIKEYIKSGNGFFVHLQKATVEEPPVVEEVPPTQEVV